MVDVRRDQTAYFQRARQHVQNLENLLRADLEEERKTEASHQASQP